MNKTNTWLDKHNVFHQAIMDANNNNPTFFRDKNAKWTLLNGNSQRVGLPPKLFTAMYLPPAKIGNL